MEAKNVLNLFDSYWYDLDFFKRSKPIKDTKIPEIPSSYSDLPALPTVHTKPSPVLEKMGSNSSKLSASDSSFSPNSVLFSTHKLQPIFSGKVTTDFDDLKSEKTAQEQENTQQRVANSSLPIKGNVGNTRRRKKRGLSKSLSDLEFEELKGFMDLGFVFSEEDKDSTLATIVPGIHRLGNVLVNNKNSNNVAACDKIGWKSVDKSAVSRPYLSEAWEVLEKKKNENSVLMWKVPAAKSEIDMKGYLRFWAHTVASTVK